MEYHTGYHAPPLPPKSIAIRANIQSEYSIRNETD